MRYLPTCDAQALPQIGGIVVRRKHLERALKFNCNKTPYEPIGIEEDWDPQILGAKRYRESLTCV